MHLGTTLGKQEDGSIKAGIGRDTRPYGYDPYGLKEKAALEKAAADQAAQRVAAQRRASLAQQNALTKGTTYQAYQASRVQAAIVNVGNYMPQYVPASYGDYTAQLMSIGNIRGSVPDAVYTVWFEFAKRLPQLKQENRGGQSPLPVDIDYTAQKSGDLKIWVAMGRRLRDEALAKKRARYAQLENSSRYKNDQRFRALVKYVKTRDFGIDPYQKSLLARASKSASELSRRNTTVIKAPTKSVQANVTQLMTRGDLNQEQQTAFDTALKANLAAEETGAPLVINSDTILPGNDRGPDPIINSVVPVAGDSYSAVPTGPGIFTSDAAVTTDSVTSDTANTDNLPVNQSDGLKKVALFGIPALLAVVVLATKGK